MPHSVRQRVGCRFGWHPSCSERCALVEPATSVHFYTFAAEHNRWLCVCAANIGVCFVSKNRFHAREAAAALLKMAKTTSDPAVAVGLIEAAAKLKDEAGELPPRVSARAPDVQPEGEPPEGAE